VRQQKDQIKMQDVLEKEIAGGEPVTVRIRGTERPLAYPMHAVILYKQLTGDSLFARENYDKIDVREDPERWLKCLWAGLHQFAEGKWMAPVTIEELGALVDFSNAGEISVQMAKAITQAMPKADPDAKKEKALAVTHEKLPPISAGSTSGPAGASPLPAQNS
jgi:hypothetical protein